MTQEIEKPTLFVDCPSCKTSIQWTEKFPDRPFCSVRCKNNDFIGWANEEQRIAGSASYDDIFSEGDLNDHWEKVTKPFSANYLIKSITLLID